MPSGILTASYIIAAIFYFEFVWPQSSRNLSPRKFLRNYRNDSSNNSDCSQRRSDGLWFINCRYADRRRNRNFPS